MMQAPETLVKKKTRVSGALAEADGNRTRRGPFDPPPVLKTGEPTRRSVASGKQSSGRFEVPVPGDLPLGGRLSRLGRVPPKGGSVSRQPQTSSALVHRNGLPGEVGHTFAQGLRCDDFNGPAQRGDRSPGALQRFETGHPHQSLLIQSLENHPQGRPRFGKSMSSDNNRSARTGQTYRKDMTEKVGYTAPN